MPHSDPMNKDQNPWVHYIYIFMTLLLLACSASSACTRRCGCSARWSPPAAASSSAALGEGPYVRRFTTTQMWLHVSIILSFLLLAVTGLPLKFAAAPVGAGPDEGRSAARTSQRGCTASRRSSRSATSPVHLAMLFRDIVLKKQKGYFWGWKSMTPNSRTCRTCGANVKVLPVPRPAPGARPLGVLEKFDYLAVFWGVAMIGVSGLILWFPGFFTQFPAGLGAERRLHHPQ